MVDTGMLACDTELVQLFVDDRDVFIDMVGVGGALLVVRIVGGLGR